MTAASWYHCSVKPISRSKGRTAIAAAAYRSGEKLRDDQLDQTYDYTRRRGIESSFIVAPVTAPPWAYNLQRLWNEAQAKDNRVNSRMAREVELALPNSLTPGERESLVRDFALHLVDRYGVAVSAALHEPGGKGDQRNYHAHILMTTRRIDENGFGKKTRELDDQKTGPQEVEHIREYAATLINDYLEDAGIEEWVDHRSFIDRGIEREPQKHLGVEAAAMQRRGEVSELSEKNREITEHNMQALVNELAEEDARIAEGMKAAFLPEGSEPEITEQGQPLSWQEELASFDLFSSPVVKAYEADIKQRGEIRERGLGTRWFDRTLTMFENIYYGTAGLVRTAFERLTGGNEEPEQDVEDIEPDR